MITASLGGLTPPQREVADFAAGALQRFCDIEQLRERLDHTGREASPLWDNLHEAGLASLFIAEAADGGGLPVSAAAGVLYHSGRYGLPEPYLETAVVAVELLQQADTELAQQVLAQIGAGQALVGIAFPDSGSLVAFGSQVDYLLDLTVANKITLYAKSEWKTTPVDSVDELIPLARLTPHATGHQLSTDPEQYQRAIALIQAGAACQLAGVLAKLVELTVEYVGLRQQFNRPIGSFQAVKHKAATMAISADMASAAAIDAMTSATTAAVETFAQAAMVAKAYGGEVATAVSVDALQLHGGIGFTWEHHLHIWLKRVIGLCALYGRCDQLRQDLARQLLTQLGEPKEN